MPCTFLNARHRPHKLHCACVERAGSPRSRKQVENICGTTNRVSQSQTSQTFLSFFVDTLTSLTRCCCVRNDFSEPHCAHLITWSRQVAALFNNLRDSLPPLVQHRLARSDYSLPCGFLCTQSSKTLPQKLLKKGGGQGAHRQNFQKAKPSEIYLT